MSLKLHFDSELKYQLDAINSVVDLFKGQTPKESNFTVAPAYNQMRLDETGIGIANHLSLTSAEILQNLQEVQEKNGLSQSKALDINPYMEFEVDMETGTGKTYVFIRTIMELNKKYGFKKFIIVVPSLAIKEGIHHSLKTTQNHMQSLYENENYNYFVYNSDHLDEINRFATADHISIMIINIQAFNRSFGDSDRLTKANIIHRPNDRGPEGRPPIELIQETNPIVIIDEPQSTSNTKRSNEAIASLNPLAALKYSATHIKPKNVVYRLNAVDAHALELVKQIEVVSFEEEDNYEDAYIRLIKTGNPKSGIYADVEIDQKMKSGIIRRTIRIRQGDDLYELSGNREVYQGFQVADIDAANNIVTFTQRSEVLTLDNHIGGIEDDLYKRLQIEATIRAHLDKELYLNKLGIKVLSLFFLDRVVNYRVYNEDGTYNLGKYAVIFEELYKKIIQEDKYQELRAGMDDLDQEVRNVHHGYFSQDKAGRSDVKFVETSSGNATMDDYAYELIMKDKERLLSFDSKLKFIFSHSALKEGWDNPNVFQICTLNDTYSDIKKRQEIGRGLRLAVNQEGERQYGFTINTLTVIANESYEVFADTLQKEYEEDSGIRFGYIEDHLFANLVVVKDGFEERLGSKASKKIVRYFKEKDYISKTGEVQEKLKIAIKNNNLDIQEEFEPYRVEIESRTKQAIEGVKIKRAREKKTVELNKERYLSPEFKELWDKIKYQTVYQVDFSTEGLIAEVLKTIKHSLTRKQRRISQIEAAIRFAEGGITGAKNEEDRYIKIEPVALKNLPDVVTNLQNATDLTRKTIIEILTKSDTLDIFQANPQIYMQEMAAIINSVKENFIVDGIKYSKIGESNFYAQELFKDHELSGYLNDNLIESKKGVYEYVVYDSQVEEKFAQDLENNKDVLVYVKLPNWFKIPTPLGGYNPDWAILINEKGEEKFYFVTETKSALDRSKLRTAEVKKIDCGKEHFKVLEEDVEYMVATNLDDVLNQLNSE
ncbi:DEAD/DEAH box helicase family protein [Facklamia sp. 7083-14-GEN3]|uniref:restriction endonuclease n=1 Tax=Facklamia sp. 7083-14-GEN3 TaxID=2973478 RepID=UPI00215B95C8|nr:DEAD/DEAH box helicase family protein [Facklamia sp. 7083-14-GEN3]MCR8969082.1 DEAD/DEAH box helicase family protein [Facklamia sp. 7083-14-GEN3]